MSVYSANRKENDNVPQGNALNAAPREKQKTSLLKVPSSIRTFFNKHISEMSSWGRTDLQIDQILEQGHKESKGNIDTLFDQSGEIKMKIRNEGKGRRQIWEDKGQNIVSDKTRYEENRWLIFKEQVKKVASVAHRAFTLLSIPILAPIWGSYQAVDLGRFYLKEKKIP